MSEVLFQIEAGYFCCGIVVSSVTRTVIREAPIVKYMHGWTSRQVARYCAKKGWLVQRVGCAGAC